ncbi:MAG TPA: class I SAM-dependent RNA methyltransferase [Ktedonobacterales bacterium]|nr:class I SAM-dependent RNA methyltransferase [Ktedonobacterales bacterium]
MIYSDIYVDSLLYWISMLHPDHPQQTSSTEQASPRRISARYRVRVEALETTGEARGAVVAVEAEPPRAEWELIYGSGRVPAEPQRQFSFIGGLPGELVEIEVSWSLPRPGRKRAKRVPPPSVRLLQVLEAAAERVTAPCPVFGECGGCQLQHMAYSTQLAWKTERMRRLLAAAGFDDALVLPAIGSESPWHYRNHMRFSVNREGQAGLTARGSHRVLPLRNCPIAHKRINDALAVLSEEQLPQPQVLVRYGIATNQMLIQPAPPESMHTMLEAIGLDIHESDIEEAMGGQRFRIRPSSFFQTNTAQANRMAELVLERLPSGQETTHVDAYCGVGTFARLMADHAGTVIAIEESASAIRDARWNLRDAPNVEIVQAKVEDVLPQMTQALDGLVIDPPRTGCQPPVLDALVARRVPRVVYVSCGPESLVRDLTYLCRGKATYRVISVQPLDMFPQTAHIENIVTLEAC